MCACVLPETKSPGVGSGHYHLVKSQGINYQEIPVNSQQTSWELDLAPGLNPVITSVQSNHFRKSYIPVIMASTRWPHHYRMHCLQPCTHLMQFPHYKMKLSMTKEVTPLHTVNESKLIPPLLRRSPKYNWITYNRLNEPHLLNWKRFWNKNDNCHTS